MGVVCIYVQEKTNIFLSHYFFLIMSYPCKTKPSVVIRSVNSHHHSKEQSTLSLEIIRCNFDVETISAVLKNNFVDNNMFLMLVLS